MVVPMRRFHILAPVVVLALVSSCRSQPGATDHAADGSDVSLVPTAHAAPPPPPAAKLDPSRGQEIGLRAEAFLTPHQEPEEEANTPKGTPKQFQSTAPSKSRAEREAAGHRAHGTLRFTRDLSRAYVDVKVEGIAIDAINMFHIHCGKPGILGPILVDFSLATDIQKNFEDGVFSVEVTNNDIVQTSEHGHGPLAEFTMGCVIPSPSLSGLKTKVSTVAGMAQMAEDGELYFNLHTKGQTFYGDIRGQIMPVDD
jgi:hypothetical protein